MTITTVIFDFGGVITTSPFDAFNRFEAERGFLKNVIRRINATNPNNNAWALFERNEIDAAQFDELFAAEAAARKHMIRGSEVLALLSGDIRPRMVETLDTLKAKGFTLGCITNNVQTGSGAGMAGSSSKAAAIAAIMARFDYVIESSKAGIRKPDPRIYTMMCDALGVAPEACIYLDDLGINCKPAAAMGMIAIKVEGEDQALAALDNALGHILSA
ncbi:MAG: HAD-IA family hydrolase [Sphingomonadaceae bacterium]